MSVHKKGYDLYEKWQLVGLLLIELIDPKQRCRQGFPDSSGYAFSKEDLQVCALSTTPPRDSNKAGYPKLLFST